MLPSTGANTQFVQACTRKVQGLHRNSEGQWLPVSAHAAFRDVRSEIEVQIRTAEMHRVAETGIASHWRYKSKSDDVPTGISAHRWLVDLIETQKGAGNPSEFLEHLKTDLFPDEIYVFTPKGDIKKLPKGASALDFAYAVHSDVGNHCIGARSTTNPYPYIMFSETVIT
ncbi:MAG: hypothetical protein CM1200mP20_10780 [Pseudomonadota bacterium]|nr:MAG: hypothetical protein CM1200mP20_10780 [Pseudomonadota bacterium]